MQITSDGRIDLRCPRCGEPVAVDGDQHRCANDHRFTTNEGVVNFLGELNASTHVGEITHDREAAGIVLRTENYLMPWLQARFADRLDTIKVLEDGAGGGAQVREYLQRGVDAYGIDPGFRSAQWSTLQIPAHRMFIADGTRLPFPDSSFDAVTSSGVLEHIGEPRPIPQRDPFQGEYVREILRVLKPGGAALIAHPNGGHPFEFWHLGKRKHGVRVHRPFDHWMPDAHQVRRWVATSPYEHEMQFLSPENYLAFNKVRRHMVGRVLTGSMKAVFRGMTLAPALAGTAVNPWLVTEIVKK